MSNEYKQYITEAGAKKLRQELKHLVEVDQKNMLRQKQEAAAFGDFRENAELSAAKEALGKIEKRIKEIRNYLKITETVNVRELSGKYVMFGTTVKLIDEETKEILEFTIVGEEESDVDKNLFSMNAPISLVVRNKRENDVFYFEFNEIKKKYRVVSHKIDFDFLESL